MLFVGQRKLLVNHKTATAKSSAAQIDDVAPHNWAIRACKTSSGHKTFTCLDAVKTMLHCKKRKTIGGDQ